MIEKVIQWKNILSACRQVVSNKGAAGVDAMKVDKVTHHVQVNRDNLTTAMVAGVYLPQAILGVEIPKSNGKSRLLGIPTVTDRVLQQALYQVLMPLYELEFKPHSYGFRPARSGQQAVLQAQKYINQGYQHIVEIDLKNFFDEVNHTLLLQLLYRKVKCRVTLCLLRRWLRAPILLKGKLVKRRKGVPQGSPLSPLLSNILLHELDKEMEKQGLCYVRYADDFSVYCRSEAQARKAGNSIYLFLRDKLRLAINREKSGIRKPVNFQVLGYSFVSRYEKGSKGQYQLTVGEKAWQGLKEKLKSITRKTLPLSFDQRVDQLKEVYRGWLNYFRLGNIVGKLKELDSWLRNRLRYCIWHDWKKPERKRKNLIRLGVSARQAYQWSRTRMGGWAVAQSPILTTTVTKGRLQRRGYEAMLDYYKKISPQWNEPLHTGPYV